MNLNRKEIIEKILDIKKQEAELGVTIHLDPDDILDNKQSSMFYGGCIGRIEYGKYVITINAYGDIRANLYVDGCNVCYVKDRGNNATFAQETRDLIASDTALDDLTMYCNPDEEIYNNTRKVLFVDENNWLEANVYVVENGKQEYLEVGTGDGICNNVLDSCDVLEAFVGISGYIECIQAYEKEEAALTNQPA